MSKRNQNWEKLFNNSKITDRLDMWLKDKDKTTFQISSVDFKNENLEPVKMIPQYNEKNLPDIFKKNDLSFIRNEKGGCLLIKKKNTSNKSLFPKLIDIEDRYQGKSFQSIPDLDLYKSKKLINEETGIDLGWKMGIIQNFLRNSISTNESFIYCGRLKTTVKEKFRLNNEEISLDAHVECDAYFESKNKVIVLECKQAKKNFKKDFSLHQIFLPYILVKSQTKKEVSCIYFDFKILTEDNENKIVFRFYQFEFIDKVNSLNYRMTNSKIYTIDLDFLIK